MSEPSTPIDIAERTVKLLREAVLFGLVGYLAWYLVPFIPKLTSKLDQAQISEISLAGVGFKLAQAEQKLEQAVQSAALQKSASASDESVAPAERLVVEALESVRALSAQTSIAATGSSPETRTPKPAEAPAPSVVDTTFWVYLGVAKGDSIPPRNFKTTKLPSPGETITATTDVYKRGSAPRYKEGDGWLLGDVVGVVRTGQTVTVRRLEKIESTTPGFDVVWAQVALPK